MKIKNVFNLLKNKLLGRGGLALGFQILGLSLALGLSMLIGRFFGIEATGLIALGATLGSVIGKISNLGVGAAMTKWTSYHAALNQHEKAVGGIRTAFRFTLISSSLASLLLLATIYQLNWFDVVSDATFHLLAVILFGNTLISIASINIGALKGLKKPWQSIALQNVPIPMTTVITCIIYYILKNQLSFNTYLVIWISMVLFASALRRMYLLKITSTIKPAVVKLKEVLKFSRPFYFASLAIFALSQIDNLFLGSLSTTKELGGYAVAFRLAQLLTIFQALMTSFSAPMISEHFAKNELDKIRLTACKATTYIALLALPLIPIYILFGETLLGIWGEEFSNYHNVLIVLVFSQFINVALGPCGQILIISDHGNIRNAIALITVLLDALLNYIFIQSYGALGAAIATGFAICFMNLAFWLAVRIKFGYFVLPNPRYL